MHVSKERAEILTELISYSYAGSSVLKNAFLIMVPSILGVVFNELVFFYGMFAVCYLNISSSCIRLEFLTCVVHISARFFVLASEITFN